MYLLGVRSITGIFRDSLGLFWHARYRGFIEDAFNIAFSLAAIRFFGEIGIFIGTTVSMLAAPIWMEPKALYNVYFKKPLAGCFGRLTKYSTVVALGWLTASKICSIIQCQIVIQMIVRAIVGLTVPSIILILLFSRSEEFPVLWKSLSSITLKIRERRGGSTCSSQS